MTAQAYSQEIVVVEKQGKKYALLACSSTQRSSKVRPASLFGIYEDSARKKVLRHNY